jgi:NAD(P)H-hydrate epimerase
MQQIDHAAIHTFGIPRLLLMDHAGLALARAVVSFRDEGGARGDAQQPILVCCGSGLNGGDGLSAARHLEGWGVATQVILIGRDEALREEPRFYATMLHRLGVPRLGVVPSERSESRDEKAWSQTRRWIAGCRLIIDALLGIGVRGAVRAPHDRLIEWMNRSGKPIVAADVPSGLDADTGLVQGVAVRATQTVTFGLPKRGCFLEQGPAHTGRLMVEPITLPRRLLAE